MLEALYFMRLKVAIFSYLLVRHNSISRPAFIALAIIFMAAAAYSIIFINFSEKNKFVQVSQSHKSSA
jgi:hypothetical protein